MQVHSLDPAWEVREFEDITFHKQDGVARIVGRKRAREIWYLCRQWDSRSIGAAR